MSRPARPQNSTLYLGLFIIFFALYAREHQKVLAGNLSAAPVAVIPTEKVVIPPSQRIQELAALMQGDSLFQVKADGLAAAYGFEVVVVTFSGDEVFSEGEFAFRETWYSVLDRVSTIIKPFLQRGLKIEVIGFTDIGSLKERRPSDYGESDYALSFARAEWVGRFLERRALIPIRERVKLTGAGAVKAGRKVELKFTFDIK